MSRKRRPQTRKPVPSPEVMAEQGGAIRRIVLISAAGAQVKEFWCPRFWGRIQDDGRWYASDRLKGDPAMEHVYTEQREGAI